MMKDNNKYVLVTEWLPVVYDVYILADLIDQHGCTCAKCCITFFYQLADIAVASL